MNGSPDDICNLSHLNEERLVFQPDRIQKKITPPRSRYSDGGRLPSNNPPFSSGNLTPL